ncbi:hypothetical protein Lesp02_19060 [Lentzea sp. NBRC 105346]|nr:hypothetical protein Lesp02_19060 [Lentzea sp. NBRC 105346]
MIAMTIPAGITREHIDGFELYRGAVNKDKTPGCVVLVKVDTENAEVAREWVDAVFHAIETDPDLPREGGISAHFHISADGKRVINYAEWISEEAHVAALEAPGQGVGSDTPEWRRVQNFPGVTPVGFDRYSI